MSVSELRTQIERWDAEERCFAAAYLRHLGRVDTLANQIVLASGVREFEEGKCFTLEQVERLHEALKAEGK